MRNRVKQIIMAEDYMVAKFVRYETGAKRYGMSESKFKMIARKSDARYKIDGTLLVNTEKFERFLENFAMEPME